MNIFLKCILCGCCLLIFSCNYNYYLGKKYEQDNRYEESYEEFQKALISNPDNIKFINARNNIGKLVVEDMYQRYKKSLQNNQLYQANHLLNRALSINPDYQPFIDEKENWFKVILIGQVEVDYKNINPAENWYENVSLNIDFDSPNLLQAVQSKIDIKNGQFITSDLLYKPTFSFISFYKIASIGIRYNNVIDYLSNIPQTEEEKKIAPRQVITTEEFIPLIELKQLRIERAQGVFDWANYTQQGSINDSILQPSNNTQEWISDEPIVYSTLLDEDKIIVKSSSGAIPFLPRTVYISVPDKFFVLNFGQLKLQKDTDKNIWQLKRIPINSDQPNIHNTIQNNLVYHNFASFNGKLLPVEPQNNTADE